MIFESLLYGKVNLLSSMTDGFKLGLGIFTVMFGFTLWVLIHERTGGINMRLLLPTLALYALATAVSHLIESISILCLIPSSIWPSTHIEVWRLSSHTETYPVALSPISKIYRVWAISSKICFMFYKLCWAISAWWENMTVTITHRHDTISQIYRCSVVWQHNIWIITLPILLWISCAGKWPILNPLQRNDEPSHRSRRHHILQ